MKLDKEGIRQFVENEVKPFLAEIVKMTKPDTFAPSLAQIIGKDQYDNPDWFGLVTPLAIGLMGAENGPGAPLNKKVATSGESVVETLELHRELFTEIEQALEETVEKLFKAQGDNLEKVDGDKFMDFFTDVDDILADSGSNERDKS
ncbi:type VII secretion system-associated protein [Streptomyces sp.]|uniref:type VII secretion system-associated protein n=1 Tax=Streptomyces sp. TaxID=1931 RepID=UPI002F3F693A